MFLQFLWFSHSSIWYNLKIQLSISPHNTVLSEMDLPNFLSITELRSIKAKNSYPKLAVVGLKLSCVVPPILLFFSCYRAQISFYVCSNMFHFGFKHPPPPPGNRDQSVTQLRSESWHLAMLFWQYFLCHSWLFLEVCRSRTIRLFACSFYTSPVGNHARQFS